MYVKNAPVPDTVSDPTSRHQQRREDDRVAIQHPRERREARAGQVALDPSTGQIVPGDIRTQTKQAMKNLDAILRQAGTSMDRVVKTTVYLKDMNEFSQMNEVYSEFFPANPPARSTVEVVRLPKDARVEIDVIALIDLK